MYHALKDQRVRMDRYVRFAERKDRKIRQRFGVDAFRFKVLEQLEPRLLLSGDVQAGVRDDVLARESEDWSVANVIDRDLDSSDNAVDQVQFNSTIQTDETGVVYFTDVGGDGLLSDGVNEQITIANGLDVSTDGIADVTVTVPESLIRSSEHTSTEYVFVDAGIDDADALIQGIGENAVVVTLNGDSDGIEQIRSALSGVSGLKAIHVVSHGSSGSAVLGNGVLNASTLGRYAADLARIGQSLAVDGDILFYGCDLAAGSDGQAFVDDLAELTAADVAASTDLTGAASLGGDWDLEYQAGSVDSELAISRIARAGFNSTLTTTVTVDGSGNLIIEDVDGADTSDAWTVAADGTDLTITDNNANPIDLTGSLDGGTGDGSAVVTVPLSSFTGTMTIDARGGDDTITIDTLTLLANQSMAVTQGTGADSVSVTGVITITGSGSISIGVSGSVTVDGGIDSDGGDVSVVATEDIFISANIDSSPASGTGGSITLNSDSDQATTPGGGIEVDSATITSAGGDIILGGGVNPGTTNALGTSATLGSAVVVNNSTINSATGNISIRGTSQAGLSSGTPIGVTLSSSSVSSTSGSVSINGQGNSATGGAYVGVSVAGNASLTTTDGNILIEADGGVGGGSSHDGLSVQGTIESTGAGTVTVNAQGGDTSSGLGITLLSGSIAVKSGTLTVNATGGTDSSGAAIAGNGLVSNGSGSIVVTGIGDGASPGLAVNGPIGGSSASGNITLISDSLQLESSASVESDGTLTIKPLTASSTIGIGGGTGTLNLLDSELTKLVDGFSGITIGDAVNGDGAVDVDAYTFTDPVTIVGGSISVTGIDAGSNTITLHALNGAITDGGDTDIDVTADGFAATATAGVGTSANALETAVTNFEADGGVGGVNVTDGGDLTIGGVSGSVTGVSATSGGVSLTTVGSITVDEAIAAGASDVALTAGQSVALGSSAVQTSSTSTAAVTITAGGTITDSGSTDNASNIAVTGDGAGVTLDAAGVIGADGAGEVGISFNGASSDLNIDAVAGYFLQLIDAGNGQLDTLNIIGGAGAGVTQQLSDDDDESIGAADLGLSLFRVTTDSTRMTLEINASDIDVTYQAASGELIGQQITTGSGDIDLSGDSDVTVGILETTGDIDVVSTSGSILQGSGGTSGGVAFQVGGTGDDVGEDIHIDDAGNVYVTGSFSGTVDFDPGPGDASRSSNGESDIFVAKYNNDGELEFALTLGGSGIEVLRHF